MKQMDAFAKGLQRNCKVTCRQHVRFKNYYYGHQIKEDEMGEACSTLGEMRNGYKILVGKT